MFVPTLYVPHLPVVEEGRGDVCHEAAHRAHNEGAVDVEHCAAPGHPHQRAQDTVHHGEHVLARTRRLWEGKRQAMVTCFLSFMM